MCWLDEGTLDQNELTLDTIVIHPEVSPALHHPRLLTHTCAVPSSAGGDHAAGRQRQPAHLPQ